MSGEAFITYVFLRCRELWRRCNDLYLNIETSSRDNSVGSDKPRSRQWWLGPETHRARNTDNYIYSSPDYWYIYKIIEKLKPGPEDVVYDIGAGKGRFLCVAARKKVRECVGIELLKPLCEIAERNASRLRGRKVDIRICCADAASADLSHGTIYFMFNPFGARTMFDTLERVRTSLVFEPRSIKIVYYNPVHESVLRACTWLEHYDELLTARGQRITFWKNIDAKSHNS